MDLVASFGVLGECASRPKFYVIGMGANRQYAPTHDSFPPRA